MSARVVAIVPARLASSRFPNKPLAVIAGLPMIEHVRRRVAMVEGIDEVVVATCDETIRRTVEGAGGRVVMTDMHERCTDRVEEAARSLDVDIVVIVQGDEPLVLPDAVRATIAPLLGDQQVVCTNLLSTLKSRADLNDPDIVKAVCDRRGDVLYFTRAAIPFYRIDGDAPVYRQTGIMAMRHSLLSTYATLAETPLERVESVDMLRLVEHGYPIRGVILDYDTVGVDRPADVARVEQVLGENPVQQALLKRTFAPLARRDS